MKHLQLFRGFFLQHTNPVIRFLILGDVMFYSAAGLLGPIFAIFVLDFIPGATIAVAGTATAIALVTRSIGQIPAARFIDRIRGDVDDFWFMFGGLAVASLLPLFYLVISTPLQLYLVQFAYGLALAFNWPSFYGLFTKYIPLEREATAWSIYQTFVDLGGAAAAATGGILAQYVGFDTVIVGVSTLGLAGALALIPIKKHLRAYAPVKA